jgi:mono/diheme cytochrome c family protein
MNKLFYTFLIGAFVVSCAPKVIETAVIEEEPPQEMAPSEEADGSKLYAANCVRCHGFKNPGDFTAEEWKEIVPRMAVKAKIDTYTESKILEYVMANAKQ